MYAYRIPLIVCVLLVMVAVGGVSASRAESATLTPPAARIAEASAAPAPRRVAPSGNKLPWLMLGTGLLMLAGGTALIARDQDA